MRIKFTTSQIAVIHEVLPEWVEGGDIIFGKTYADIPDDCLSDVLSDFREQIKVVGVSARVADAVDTKLADACTVKAPEDAPEGEDPTDPYALPQPVILALACISRGEYGPEPARLAEGMDDRPNERITRWVARLRHKLISAGLTEAADAIRIVNPGSV